MEKRWNEQAKSCFQEAKQLHTAGHARGTVSRTYYALYAGVTSKVIGRASFHFGWRNPHHSQLPKLVDQIRGVRGSERSELRKGIKRLYRLRLQADYDPEALIDSQVAKEALRVALPCFAILGLEVK
jgi:uncharacterized protein (UPF0332 family)